MWILIFVSLYTGGTNTVANGATLGEYNSRTACETAAKSVREGVKNERTNNSIVLTCAKKD